MYALVIIACLTGGPPDCYAFPSAERYALAVVCQREGLRRIEEFKRTHPGWRYDSALCIDERNLETFLNLMNGRPT